MNQPKNQHWVPKSYLRYFATPGSRDTKKPKVWRFDKARPYAKPHLRSIREVCASDYLYSPPDINGDRNFYVEKMLDTIETAAGEYWRSLDSGDADLLDPKLRNAIGRFLGAMQLRTRFLFDKIEKTMQLRDQLNLLRGDYKPVGGLDALHSGRFFVQTLQRGIDPMMRTFLEKQWVIGRTDQEIFVTSDIPIIYISAPGARAGPGTPNTTAAFPLGPRSVLLMDERFKVPNPLYHSISEAFARQINLQFWKSCQREMVTGRQPDDVAAELNIEYRG